jgi:hypothetical protein
MSENLEQKIELMKREVDAIQIAIMGQKAPWYRNISTILSIVALCFSFGTTFVSYIRTEKQDIQNTRQELRGLLQRLAVLPKEYVEIEKKYASDQAAMQVIGGLINQESTLLVRQAAELAKKLPKNLVSSTEYYSIAVALQSSYDLVGAAEFLKYTIEAAKDFNTEIAAIRMTAAMHYQRGKPEAGRVEYQRALDIFAKYPEFDPFTRASTNISTELAWTGSEANIGAMNLANLHIESGKSIVNGLPASPGTNNLRAQIAQTEAFLAAGRPNDARQVPPQAGLVPVSARQAK